ncbi:MAG TPA: AraC family transcriptional regulator [Pseudobacter sp.]|nr:AraC family transcriptional regulator [Pseudobacter sp.]
MNKSAIQSTFELLAADHVQLNKSWNYKDVTSTFYRLYYIDEGTGKLFNAGSSIRLQAGYLYMVPAFTNCNYYCSDFLSQYYICFTEGSPDGSSLFFNNRKLFQLKATERDISTFKQILHLNPGRGLQMSYNPKVFEKANVLRGMGDQNRKTPLSDFVETCGLLLQLIAKFLGSPDFSEDTREPFTSIIADSIYYIQTNLKQEITVGALAKRANKTPDHFSRLFFTATGELPLEYIQKKRIAQAQLLLATTGMPISEIADETGFQSVSYFIRIFRRLTNKTPGEYKRSNPVLG